MLLPRLSTRLLLTATAGVLVATGAVAAAAGTSPVAAATAAYTATHAAMSAPPRPRRTASRRRRRRPSAAPARGPRPAGRGASPWRTTATAGPRRATPATPSRPRTSAPPAASRPSATSTAPAGSAPSTTARCWWARPPTHGEAGGVHVLDMRTRARPVETARLLTAAMDSPHESLALNAARGLLAAGTGSPATAPGIVDVYDVSQDCRHPVLTVHQPARHPRPRERLLAGRPHALDLHDVPARHDGDRRQQPRRCRASCGAAPSTPSTA